MNLYKQYISGNIDIITYCNGAIDVLKFAINETINKYNYGSDYANLILKDLAKGNATGVTSTNGARKSLIETFNGDLKKGVIDIDVFSMVVNFKELPREEFLNMYTMIRTVNKEDSRMIKKIHVAKECCDELVDCKTSKGNKQKNEDFVGIIVTDDNKKMLVLCDGCGGHKNGDIVSKLASEMLIEWFEREGHLYNNDETLERKLKIQITIINNKIKETLPNSYTTLTCAIIDDKNTLYASIGDSRLYLYKNGNLLLFTEDESYVYEEKYKMDYCNLSDLRFYRGNNVVTNAMGNLMNPIKTYYVPNECYDGMLLTSDGVTDVLSTYDLENIMNNNSSEGILDKIIEKSTTGDIIVPYHLIDTEFEADFGDRYAGIYKDAVPGSDNASAVLLLKTRGRKYWHRY